MLREDEKAALAADIDHVMAELWGMLLSFPDRPLGRLLATIYIEHFRYVEGSFKKIVESATADLDGLQAEIDADQAAKEKKGGDEAKDERMTGSNGKFY